jgi:putative ABC transport system substrate-binding protein
MKRRDFITLVGSVAAVWPLAARAQQDGRIRHVGVIVGLAEDDPEAKARFAGFRQGFEKLGWIEGRNVASTIATHPPDRACRYSREN